MSINKDKSGASGAVGGDFEDFNNGIAEFESRNDAETAQELDEFGSDMPDAGDEQYNDEKTRSASALKKYGIIALIVLIVAVGIVASMARMGKYTEEQKALAKQEAVESERVIETGVDSTNIDAVQAQMLADRQAMEGMPPPEDYVLLDDDATPGLVEDRMLAEQAQTQATQAPVAGQYNSYDTVEPYQPVSGQQVAQSPSAASYSSFEAIEPVEPPKTPKQIKQERFLSSGVLAFQSGGADSGAVTQVAAGGGNANNQSEQNGQFDGVALASKSAKRRSDLTYLLNKGSSIGCVLRTRINSTYQGFTTCQVAKDVYSADGKTLLIERGSAVFGEQRTQIQQGQARVSVLWTKIETPKGVSIDIDSPATGQVGQMGIGAIVDNHYWQRFGSAIMLSIIDDALTAAAARIADREGGQAQTDSTEDSAQSIAEIALENSINIPPTAVVKQGTLLNILVVRDVSFQGVYKNVSR